MQIWPSRLVTTLFVTGISFINSLNWRFVADARMGVLLTIVGRVGVAVYEPRVMAPSSREPPNLNDKPLGEGGAPVNGILYC